MKFIGSKFTVISKLGHTVFETCDVSVLVGYRPNELNFRNSVLFRFNAINKNLDSFVVSFVNNTIESIRCFLYCDFVTLELRKIKKYTDYSMWYSCFNGENGIYDVMNFGVAEDVLMRAVKDEVYR